MTEAKIVQAMALIQAKFAVKGSHAEFTQAVRELFLRTLCGLPDDIGMAAVEHTLLCNVYLPDPATILERAALLLYAVPDPDTAWREVFRECGRVHPTPPVHPLTQEALEMVGGYTLLWHQYKYSHTPVTVLRAQFLECFQRRVTAIREKVKAHLLAGKQVLEEATQDRSTMCSDDPAKEAARKEALRRQHEQTREKVG